MAERKLQVLLDKILDKTRRDGMNQSDRNITDTLITIFANDNLIFFPIRKISFFALNNFLFIRKIVLNQMTKSLIFSKIR